MDIGKSIGFVFEDEDWVTKVLIGGIVGAIPIVNLAALGYALRTLQNVAAGRERPLPGWEDFGDYFVQGVQAFVATLIYAIPLIAVAGVAVILSLLTDSRSGSDLAGLCFAALACVQVFLGLAWSLWTPAALMNFAGSGDMAAFFRFDEIWGLISRNLGDYIVALLAYLVIDIVAGVVGIVLCLIGTIFTSFVATVIFAHLLGQVLGQSRRPAPAEAA